VILCGDAPLIRRETLKDLVATHRRQKNAVTLLTARVANPFGYGRIVRDHADRPCAIVEEKDATPEQRGIDEINSGTYCFRVEDLLRVLRRIKPNNAKGEYYITDAIALLVKDKKNIGAVCAPDSNEVLGVNRRRELAEADKLLRRRILENLMDEGVTVVDPDSTYVDAEVTVGRDSVLLPQTFLKGKTRVGARAKIGPFSVLQDCEVKDGVELKAVFASEAVFDNDVYGGPFAHFRPGTVMGPGSRAGNFVEIKKSKIGPRSKVNHLAYVGDAELDERVNIGAGVITCNYDGFQKSRTVIGSGAFIGSNVNLVAPVNIGAGAVVGAGSTITKDVPSDALAIERATQLVKKDWARRRRSLRPAPHKSS
jgi:bifunctional UDP-N-acetylglucosamine pyrophosphorylase / glucosamine-1-phosphate N-acetyltransferase